MQYDPASRRQISAEAAGKTVASLEFVDNIARLDDSPGKPLTIVSDPMPYWVMTFTDGSEISFRFMAELVTA